jgi:hypothetical protein
MTAIDRLEWRVVKMMKVRKKVDCQAADVEFTSAECGIETG